MRFHHFLYIIFTNFCFFTNIKIIFGVNNEIEVPENNDNDNQSNHDNPLSGFQAKSVPVELKVDDFDDKIQKVLKNKLSSRRSAIDAALRREELDSRQKDDSSLDNSETDGTGELSQDQSDIADSSGEKNSEGSQSLEKQRITNENQQSSAQYAGVRILDSGGDLSDINLRNDFTKKTTKKPPVNVNRNILHSRKKLKKTAHEKFKLDCQSHKSNCGKHHGGKHFEETDKNNDENGSYILKQFNSFVPLEDQPSEDKNLTRLAQVISKHIVDTLPDDIRHSKWASKLAFKIVYEKLKMYRDGNFAPFGSSFQKNSMLNNASDNECCGCCCNGGDTGPSDNHPHYGSNYESQIVMKVGGESTYKCWPTIDQPPSDGYVLLDDVGWFKLHTKPIVWNEARKQCRNEGGYLAFFESEEEAQWCMDHLLTKSTTEIFLGVHNYFQEEWVTVRDTPVYKIKHLIWSKKQPTEYRNYNCAIISKKDKIVVRESCKNVHSFICKIPL